ncbi:hypothetical protein [Longimicrobium sp.]|uniref:hypothetical protein n=1 Tax=Longimicrobium sp. TaxID=2029185 RepID=UPI002E32B197|nr:hypothetical protein [Longimicrobium sp.]HEX6038425.1 hypothetical protein [Longimicrobium sp.]
MCRHFICLAALALLAAAPAAAQPSIQPGQTVEGELSAQDPALRDRSHFDLFRFQAEADHVYHVTLRSDDFDAYLAVGADAGPECGTCDTDDDGAGGTDAELRFTAGSAGLYQIRANSYGTGQTGRYTLVLEDEGVPTPADTVAAPGTVILNLPVQGRLDRPDEKADNGAYIDTYTYQGRAGETLVITLESDDFDAYVRVGAVHQGACRPVQGDDNGGGGTNSRLRVRIPNDGDFHVHVSSRRRGEAGDYTLTVVRG